MPADFVEVYLANSWEGTRQHFAVGHEVMRRWRRECGITDKPSIRRRVMPADFALVAPTMTKMEMKAHYQTTFNTITRWLEEAGVRQAKPKPSGNALPRPAPADFAALAPTMTKSQLHRHYNTSWDALTRWLVETGTTPADPPKARHQPTYFRNNPQHRIHRDVRQTDIYDDAADVIRRERFAVHRCDDRGRYAPKGGFWRVGIVILTPDELLQRADKYRRKAA